MKRVIYSGLVLTMLLFLLSARASAHMMGDFGGSNQLWEVEEEMMGEQAHERMEELMEKMLDGNLTDPEQKEMISMMRDPQSGAGAMSMMMRMTGGGSDFGLRSGMMSWGSGYGNYWTWLAVLTWIVWLIVGIFVIVLLWKKITRS